MKAGLIGPAPPLRGGISAHTAGLHDALSAAGHSVRVLSYSRIYPWESSGERAPSSDSAGCTMLDGLDPTSWRRAGRWLAGWRCDAVFVQWWSPVVGPAIRVCLDACAAPRSIFICHNASPHERFPGWRALTRAALARADAVITHSLAVRAELVRRVPRIAEVPSQVCAMPLLVDVAGAMPTRAVARHRLGLPSDGPVALSFGHVRAYKGVERLLRAWDRAALPGAATLLIAGRSHLGRGRLEHRVRRLARHASVHVIDRYLDDAEVRAALAAADVMVLPYDTASQSGSLPLALAAGLSVVASDAGGLSESLAAGRGHFVVPAGDDAKLAEALSAALGRAARLEKEGADSSGAVRQSRSNGLPSTRLRSWAQTVAACESLVGGAGLERRTTAGGG